jgi:hypothetical protein
VKLSIKAINKQMADEEVRSQAKVYSYCDAFLCGVVSKVPLYTVACPVCKLRLAFLELMSSLNVCVVIRYLDRVSTIVIVECVEVELHCCK